MAPFGEGLPVRHPRGHDRASNEDCSASFRWRCGRRRTRWSASGRFNLARSAAEEGIRLASDFGHRSGASWNLTVVALLDALRGDESAVRAHADEAMQLAAISGGDLDPRLRRVDARIARLDAGKAGRGDRPPAARDSRRAARVESADRAVVDPRPDRSGGTLRAARRGGGSVRPLHGLGAALVVAGAPVRARALPGAGGGGRRARAVRDGARAWRDPLAVPAGPHRAALRRVAAARAPAARGAPASAQGGRPLPPGRRAAVGGARRRRSCAPPARRPGGATPRRSTSSPRRSCRSPGSSPPG